MKAVYANILGRVMRCEVVAPKPLTPANVKLMGRLNRKEFKLRKLHTDQTQAGKWVEAQTTRAKLIAVLNQINQLESKP